MGKFIELPGVKTWYEVEGNGDPLLLLHAMFCTNETWGAQRPDLSAAYQVFLPERRAHGHTGDVAGPLSYHDMASDTIDFLTMAVAKPAHLVGFSDGAIVALLVAIARPDLVRKLVVIGGNFDVSGYLPEAYAMFDGMTPDDPHLADLRAQYDAASPDGADHWADVVAKLIDMFRREPHIPLEDLARIGAPTLVMVGDDDLFSMDHTVALWRAIPNSELAVVPGTSHTLVWEKPQLVNRLILDFLGNEPVATIMPMRRTVATASYFDLKKSGRVEGPERY